MTSNQTSTELAVVEDKNKSLDVFSNMGAFENAQRAAKALAMSKMIPTAFQNSLSDCMIALEMANRMKVSPLAVMQSLVIVHGKPTFESKFIIGVINSSRRFKKPLRFEYAGSGETLSCKVIAIDHDGEVIKGPEVSMKMARAEGWTKNSKYTSMPEQMLAYRAVSFFARLYCPDLVLGMSTTDEMIDVTPSEEAQPGQTKKAVSDLNEKIRGRRQTKKAPPVIEAEVVEQEQIPPAEDAADMPDTASDIASEREFF